MKSNILKRGSIRIGKRYLDEYKGGGCDDKEESDIVEISRHRRGRIDGRENGGSFNPGLGEDVGFEVALSTIVI